MVVDRYEIGERQTSACGIPTAWLEALALTMLQQTFGELVIHTPYTTVRYELPWTFSTFDYRTLAACWPHRAEFEFETADGRRRATDDFVQTDRGEIRAPLVVDALGWRRVLGGGGRSSRPTRSCPAASRFTRTAGATTWRSGSTAPTSGPVTGGAFRPTARCGSASARSPPLPRQGADRAARRDLAADAVRFQGNWIPHGSASDRGRRLLRRRLGRTLPATDRRGDPHRSLLRSRRAGATRAVIEGRWSRARGAAAYHAFSAAHASQFASMLRVQHLVPQVPPRVLGGGTPGDRAQGLRRLVLRPLPGGRPRAVRGWWRRAPALSAT